MFSVIYIQDIKSLLLSEHIVYYGCSSLPGGHFIRTDDVRLLQNCLNFHQISVFINTMRVLQILIGLSLRTLQNRTTVKNLVCSESSTLFPNVLRVIRNMFCSYFLQSLPHLRASQERLLIGHKRCRKRNVPNHRSSHRRRFQSLTVPLTGLRGTCGSSLLQQPREPATVPVKQRLTLCDKYYMINT